MVHYKYSDAESGLKFLRTLRLYFTPPKYFNDINEISPFVCKEFSQKDYLKQFCRNEYLRPVYSSWRAAGLCTDSYDEFVVRARSDPQIITDIANRVRRACTALQDKFKETMSKHVGVCCMSEVATSNLMWAHYADSHKGLCIGLNLDVSDIVLIDNKAVDYKDTKVRLPPYFSTLRVSDRNTYYAKISFLKIMYTNRPRSILVNLYQRLSVIFRRRPSGDLVKDSEPRLAYT